MTRLDEIIERAKDGLPESEVAILAREVLKTREQFALALRAMGDAEGRAALADRRALGMKPHVFAAMVNSVRDLALQYGQMEQFRCRVADLLGTYIHVEHGSKGATEQAKAPAVVVPESLLHDLAMAAWDAGADAGIAWCPDVDRTKRGIVPCSPEEGLAKARDHFAKNGSGSPNSAFSRALQAIREHARAIHADRVPGDGMVAVDRAELEALREFHDAYTEDGECDLDEFLQKLNSVSEKIAALRANQDATEPLEKGK